MLTMQEKARYGLEIRDMVYDASDGKQDMNMGTLYPLLRRLTNAGLLTAVGKDEDLDIRGGHTRKYYTLTPLGKTRLKNAEQLRQNLRSLSKKVTSLEEKDFPDGLQPSQAG